LDSGTTHRRSSESLSGFTVQSLLRLHTLRLQLLNFLHRVGFALTLCLGLQAAFRQRRPCICPKASEMVHVGSVYGMPSEVGMAAGIAGSFLIDHAPYWPNFSRLVGVVVIVWICMDRIVSGFNSFGQVLVGALLGCLLHFYSTR
jgi:membrane-associated phospholipid phosphatase